MRGRAWRRHQRLSHIANRKDIVRNIWQEQELTALPRWNKFFNKQHLTCRPRCGVCHPYKQFPTPRDHYVWEQHDY